MSKRRPIPPESSDEAKYRIGEVARETGLSPRAIRLYEEKGLLDPACRTASGYRLYAGRDLDRLRRILLLRRLGLDLASMAPLLQNTLQLDQNWTAPALSRLDEEIAALRAQESRLRLLRTLPDNEHSDPEAVMERVEQLAHCEHFFSPEQLLAAHTPTAVRGANGSAADPTAGDAEGLDPVAQWSALRDALDHERQAATAPDDPVVASILKDLEVMLVVSMKASGDTEADILERFWALLDSDEKLRQDHGIDAGLWEYMQKARGATLT